MTFKRATDILFAGARHDQLAKALGVSVASIRQARLTPKAKAYREPPFKWQSAVIKVAELKVNEYLKLIDSLYNEAEIPSAEKEKQYGK